jgi:putative lipase involved disintegration of autophagic bodies
MTLGFTPRTSSLSDKQRSGTLRTETDEDRRSRVFEQDVANKITVPHNQMQTISIADLGYRTLCTEWVLQMLLTNLKRSGWAVTDGCDMNMKAMNCCAALSDDEVKTAVKMRSRQQDA